MSTICICNDSFDMTRTSGFGTLSLSVLRYFRRYSRWRSSLSVLLSGCTTGLAFMNISPGITVSQTKER